MPRLVVHDQYVRDARRYTAQMRQRAAEALERFQVNPYHPGLNFEKLRGWDDLYSIRISRGFRILLRRVAVAGGGEYYAAFRMGPHDIYDRM